ncbi:RFX-type winged-helix domain-containing protein [Mycena kentingensis (nom. inval.)]|nr:RFX-type winged-helix domain-containing protein [Mycena kentingensis (nom. inval.)]
MRRNSLSSSSSFETTERLDERQSIARLLTPSSAEAQAALYASCVSSSSPTFLLTRSSENGVEDLESRLDETILAQCASYRAFEVSTQPTAPTFTSHPTKRYLSREHLIILPRTRRDLESVLSVPHPPAHPFFLTNFQAALLDHRDTQLGREEPLPNGAWRIRTVRRPKSNRDTPAIYIMLLLGTVTLCLLTGLDAVLADQLPLTSVAKPRKLHGRFLHITDIHPDPHYRPKTAESTSCHRKKGKKKKNDSGFWGQPFSECDSPFRLANLTLEFLGKKWASEIDFVVWTGDNARHDNDNKLPRTPAEIYNLNRAVSQKMVEVFASRGIPVVPSLGNNDVWPHNILQPGPNAITSEFASIWKQFIPFPYLQIFQRGAYYAVEVIPDALAVISLNTMYFYDSNKAVGGCQFLDRDDAGNLQFDWLEVQLKGFRARGMQVWISGHVPPSPGNYFPECYVRYVELALRFQDTILGHLYGRFKHMNVDHFFFLEAGDLDIRDEAPKMKQTDLYKVLMEDFGRMPKGKNINLGHYAPVSVSPSVVPNPYTPSFRIFAYNATGVASTQTKNRKHGHRHGDSKEKSKFCKLKPWQDTWRCQLNETWHSNPKAPSRRNGLWTPLGYAQYFIPHLEEGNKTEAPRFKLEYVTFEPSVLGGVEGWEPIPAKRLPSKGVRKGQAVYGLADLTVGSWVGLARRLAQEKREGKAFHKFMYLGKEEP